MLKLTMVIGGTMVVLLGVAAPARAKSAKDDPAKRGAYLVMVGGCNDCHTPLKMTPIGPMPDMDRMLSGHPEGQLDPAGTPAKTDLALSGPDLTSWKLPFGIVYTRNLTPDKTGLGEWTEAQFIKTLRTGRHQGEARPLLPPMPWFNYGGMTDEDLKAVWAFLRSIKPIKNTVPDPKVPPPVLEQFAKTNAAVVDIVINHKAPPSPVPAAAAGGAMTAPAVPAAPKK
jgi:mono/diheme cytochrome c family protein